MNWKLASLMGIVLIGSNVALAQSNKMSQIFTYEMLGTDLAYFESIAGIPMRTYQDSRTYNIDGCKVMAEIANYDNVESIKELSVDLKQGCSFIYAPDEYSTPISTDKLVFDSPGLYALECIETCPRAGGYVYKFEEGAVISDYQYTEYKTKVENVELPSLKAKLASKQQHWDPQYNDEFDYTDLIEKDLTGQKIENITIGSGYLSKELSGLVRD